MINNMYPFCKPLKKIIRVKQVIGFNISQDITTITPFRVVAKIGKMAHDLPTNVHDFPMVDSFLL